MKTQSWLQIIFVSLMMFLAGCEFVPSQNDVGSSSSLSIVEPADSSKYQVGDLVRVRSLVSAPDGGLSFDLLVNGQVYRSDHLTQALRNGTMLQPWQPTEPGSYTLQVQMVTSNGSGSTSQVVVVIVDEGSSPEVQPEPTTAVPVEEDTITPTITLTPTETLTPTPTPSMTPTWTPTLTYTPTTEPLLAPEPIAPSGSYSCRSTIYLEWNSVYSPNGIAYYEWVVDGPGGTENGTTTELRAEYFLSTCASSYRWQVRAVDNMGTIGPYSEWIDFSID